ncbi:MAG: hypothetical protein OHK0056_20920 [Bacteriovoracaceae bacterium]
MIKYVLVLFNILFAASVEAIPSWAPQKNCQQEWSKLKEQGLDTYRFDLDSKPSALGNLGYQSYKKRVKRDECLNETTVLIYMAADNDLSPYSFWDLYEMERQIEGELNLGTSKNGVDVIVEWDNKNRSGIRRLHMFQSDKKYDSSLRREDFDNMSEADVLSPVVQILPETGSGSIREQSKRFQNFLNWSIENYPSRNYVVVIWGHGEGFIGKHYERKMRWDQMNGTSRRHAQSRLLLREDVRLDLKEGKELPSKYPVDKVFGGVAFDYSELSFMDIPTVASIIDSTVEWMLEGQKMDFLAFDACLMQSIEVASEFQDSVHYLFGSTQVQNYLGLPYRSIIDRIQMGAKPSDLAEILPNLVEKSFRESYQGQVDPEGIKTMTASVINLEALKWELIPAMKDLSVAMKEYFSEDPMRALDIAFLLEQSEAFQGETRDLGIFMGALLKLLYLEEERDGESDGMYYLKKEIQSTLKVLHRMTLSRAYGDVYISQTGREAQTYLLGFFRAFGVWLPRSVEQFEHRKKEFSQSRLWGDLPEWAQVLETLYNPDL